MLPLTLRAEFLTKHMRTTAIELRNKHNSGWTQRANPHEHLRLRGNPCVRALAWNAAEPGDDRPTTQSRSTNSFTNT